MKILENNSLENTALRLYFEQMKIAPTNKIYDRARDNAQRKITELEQQEFDMSLFNIEYNSVVHEYGGRLRK